MITWLSKNVTNVWLRMAITLLIFGWLIFIAWVENRHYRNMTAIITQQYAELHADHVRAETAVRLLAGQVLKNSMETHQSTEAVKKTTKAIDALPDPKP